MNSSAKLIISFCIFTVIGCCAYFRKNVQPKRPIITIWIHGTHFVSNQTLKLLHEYINKTTMLVFKKEIPSFHAKDGLHPIQEYTQDSYLLRKAKKLAGRDPQKISFEDFYVFGWSGKLSSQSRKQSAFQLYKELQSLIKNKNYQQPYIRVITHSHGGNVALQLAQAEKQYGNQLAIDELILLACPVQHETKQLIHDPLFKTVYSLYSPIDLIQVIDPQKLQKFEKEIPLFSERCFDPCDKIKQASITMNGKHLFPAHAVFLTNKLTNHLPAIVKQMESWQPGKIGTIDIST